MTTHKLPTSTLYTKSEDVNIYARTFYSDNGTIRTHKTPEFDFNRSGFNGGNILMIAGHSSGPLNVHLIGTDGVEQTLIPEAKTNEWPIEDAARDSVTVQTPPTTVGECTRFISPGLNLRPMRGGSCTTIPGRHYCDRAAVAGPNGIDGTKGNPGNPGGNSGSMNFVTDTASDSFNVSLLVEAGNGGKGGKGGLGSVGGKGGKATSKCAGAPDGRNGVQGESGKDGENGKAQESCWESKFKKIKTCTTK